MLMHLSEVDVPSGWRRCCQPARCGLDTIGTPRDFRYKVGCKRSTSGGRGDATKNYLESRNRLQVCRRLLWIGKDRREATLHKFFDLLGEAVVPTLEYVCSDMWKAYIKVIRERAGEAVHILDRYHVMSMLSKAIDKVRADETRRLKQDGYEPILTNSRWCLLKRRVNLTLAQTVKLKELLSNSKSSKKQETEELKGVPQDEDRDTDAQDQDSNADIVATYGAPDASVIYPTVDESFTVEEYVNYMKDDANKKKLVDKVVEIRGRVGAYRSGAFSFAPPVNDSFSRGLSVPMYSHRCWVDAPPTTMVTVRAKYIQGIAFKSLDRGIIVEAGDDQLVEMTAASLAERSRQDDKALQDNLKGEFVKLTSTVAETIADSKSIIVGDGERQLEIVLDRQWRHLGVGDKIEVVAKYSGVGRFTGQQEKLPVLNYGHLLSPLPTSGSDVPRVERRKGVAFTENWLVMTAEELGQWAATEPRALLKFKGEMLSAKSTPIDVSANVAKVEQIDDKTHVLLKNSAGVRILFIPSRSETNLPVTGEEVAYKGDLSLKLNEEGVYEVLIRWR